ncbi:MAG: response regulator [Armatimonadetes bacterium]|nr:response regulator [Armatimonadota bacterium]
MKILLIEDAFLSRLREAKVLEDLGHMVISVSDGNEAVKRFNIEKPDVVITDLNMPGMDGLETIKAIRSEDPNVPIFVCSGSATREQLSLALRNGANEIFGKPLNPEHIKKVLSQVKPLSGPRHE